MTRLPPNQVRQYCQCGHHERSHSRSHNSPDSWICTACNCEEWKPFKAPSKFHNERTYNELLGRWFASKTEAEYCQQLWLLEKAGQIINLEFQRRYTLAIPKPVLGPALITHYIADAVYYDLRDQREHVIDVKGVRTKDYILKRRLMAALHGIEVEEITG